MLVTQPPKILLPYILQKPPTKAHPGPPSLGPLDPVDLAQQLEVPEHAVVELGQVATELLLADGVADLGERPQSRLLVRHLAEPQGQRLGGLAHQAGRGSAAGTRREEQERHAEDCAAGDVGAVLVQDVGAVHALAQDLEEMRGATGGG